MRRTRTVVAALSAAVLLVLTTACNWASTRKDQETYRDQQVLNEQYQRGWYRYTIWDALARQRYMVDVERDYCDVGDIYTECNEEDN